MHRYCTFFDHRYLDRGLAMIRSLRDVDPGCRISVLCLTPACERELARLAEPGVTLTSLDAFEQNNPDVLAIKDTRCLRDYYFTLSGCIVSSMMHDVADGEIITYLDADLLFHSSPEPMFEAMTDASVGVVGHRFHWWAKRLEKYGKFNVGWVSFRADDVGRAAAQWWRESCIEWCYGGVDGDRFADQKYLEHLFRRFPRVLEITHPGANLGPWNVCRHSVTPGADGRVLVDGFPLIFFHFSGVKEQEPGHFLCSHISYLGPFTKAVRQSLYLPYIARLERIRQEIGGLPPDPAPSLSIVLPPTTRERLLAPLIRTVARWAGHYVETAQVRG